jgi:hypothetical protein
MIAMINYETNKFGTITFEGKKYDLQADANFTDRQLLDWQTDEGYAEFSADAVDENGNDCKVYWILQSRDVEDLENLDWNNVDRIKLGN